MRRRNDPDYWRRVVVIAANRFANGDIDKWDAYGEVFNLLDRRRVTLRMICEEFAAVGVPGEVVQMRRRQFLGMRQR